MIKTKPSDQFPTDIWLKSVFDKWFDPCPLAKRPKRDGLNISWKKRTFVNPPYSNVLPWVLKGIEEYKKGKIIVLLLKFDNSTKWFKELLKADVHILYIGERLKHGSIYSAPFPSMLAILSHRRII